MSKIKNVYFAHITNETGDETGNIIIDTINTGNIQDNFLEIQGSRYFSRIYVRNNTNFIKFYKLRDDAPMILYNDGADHELEINSGDIAEITYFLIFGQYIAILRTGYSPNISNFLPYIRQLYVNKYHTTILDEHLNNSIVELYDNEVINALHSLSLKKFDIQIGLIQDVVIDDEIDAYFRDDIRRAVNDEMYSISFGMEASSNLSNSIKNSIIRLIPFLRKGEVIMLENNEKIKYNLIKHKIKYEHRLLNNETVNLNYDDILFAAKEWFIDNMV